MVKFKPFLGFLRLPDFKLKIKLGALLLCSTFLLNYHPAFTFPPIQKNMVYAQISQEQEVISQASPVVFQLPHPGYITTHFSSFHPGIDLCSGLGMPIKPIARGTVTEAGFNFFGLGLMVEVEHEGGYKSLYAHMGKIFVTQGQTIEAESFLGEIGMTGHTSGPHTHLEIAKDGKKINPLLVLPEIRKYPTESDFAVIQSATPSAIAIPVSIPKPSSGSATPNPTARPINTASQFIEPLKPSAPIDENESTHDLTVGVSSLDRTSSDSGKPATLQSGFYRDKLEETPKIDLKEQSLNNILSLASPKPSVAPIPRGGPISFRSFGLFAKK